MWMVLRVADRFDIVGSVVLGVDLGADGPSSRTAVGGAAAGARRSLGRLVVLGRRCRRLDGRRRCVDGLLLLLLLATNTHSLFTLLQ